jgi:hypothetical protein
MLLINACLPHEGAASSAPVEVREDNSITGWVIPAPCTKRVCLVGDPVVVRINIEGMGTYRIFYIIKKSIAIPVLYIYFVAYFRSPSIIS